MIFSDIERTIFGFLAKKNLDFQQKKIRRDCHTQTCILRVHKNILGFLKKKREHVHSELADSGEKSNLLMERFSFGNLNYDGN